MSPSLISTCCGIIAPHPLYPTQGSDFFPVCRKNRRVKFFYCHSRGYSGCGAIIHSQHREHLQNPRERSITVVQFPHVLVHLRFSFTGFSDGSREPRVRHASTCLLQNHKLQREFSINSQSRKRSQPNWRIHRAVQCGTGKSTNGVGAGRIHTTENMSFYAFLGFSF